MNRTPTDPIEQPEHDDCMFTRENLEAHALGALDPFERGMVEHHLRWCETCRDASARFEYVVETLPHSGAMSVVPAPGTWVSILARLNEPEPAETSPLPQDPPAEERALNRWSWANPSVVYPAIIAPLVLAIIVLGAWANSLSNEVDDNQRTIANQAILSSSMGAEGEVQLYSVQPNCPGCNGTGQFGVSEHSNMGMLVGADFDPTITHEVWGIQRTGEKRKFCKLVIESNGEVLQMFLFPENPSQYSELYIIDEDGGLSYVSQLSDPISAPGMPDDEPNSLHLQ